MEESNEKKEEYKELIEEIKKEQQISPFFEDSILEKYIKEGIFHINSNIGHKINYNEDLQARSLLKTYVLYANHKKLAEFKELYRRRICRFTNQIL